jgi:probable phosphoglycerate mutase
MGLAIYFLRHGQTTFSRDGAFCGSGEDPDLTAEGSEMARQFAAAYRSLRWRTIYCSPLRRALLTAQPLCEALGMTLELRDDLKEIGYGKWEGMSPQAIQRDYHDDYVRWEADPASYAPTGGESALAIASRGLRVIEEIKQRFNEGNVLVVSHKATIRVVLCSLLGIDVGRFRYRLACPVGSVTVVEFAVRGPLLRNLADRSHLEKRLRELPGT